MSFVGYIYDPGGPIPFKCGYCKSPDTSRTQGVWAYGMTCRDYQDLVDRGFQRSGKYVYRAFMKRTCCPQYVIRTDVTKFRLSKSQRAVVRKLHRYLLHGRTTACMNSVSDRKAHAPTDPLTSSEEELMATSGAATPEPEAHMDSTLPSALPISVTNMPKATEVQQQRTATDHAASVSAAAGKTAEETAGDNTAKASEHSCGLSETLPQSQSQTPPRDQPKPAVFKKPRKPVRLGAGADPNKPPCRKAKLVRRERRAQKLTEKQRDAETKQKPHSASKDPNSPISSIAGCSSSSTCTTADAGPPPQPKLFEQLLEELLTVPSAEEYSHRLDVRLVRCSPRSQEFKDTFEESFAVFKKFQMTIHKEQEADCGERQFLEFLVESPLIPEEPTEGMPCGYGSYHQQYLLDGRIFAVGVLDILPRGVLCEYLYYDPDYRFIAPGVFTALQEISLAQQFRRLKPDMQFYYMGFYVQSCPKMNYKSKYDASYLLCPETYTYVPIKKCIPKLLALPYSRLAGKDVPDGDGPLPEGSLNDVQVFEMAPMTYERYRALHGERKQSLVEDYVMVVGLELALRMRLFLGRMML